MSLSAEALQLESDAPKSAATVRPPVEDAFTKERELVVRDDAEVVARYVLPDTVSPVVEAFPSVVFPVTSSVDEKTPVVPVIAPRLATVA